jgi:hypothetical protein
MQEHSAADEPLADDLLVGANAIARFVFGTEGKRRAVYWLSENGELPTFRLGSTICARRSTLLRHIADRDQKARVAERDAKRVLAASTST